MSYMFLSVFDWEERYLNRVVQTTRISRAQAATVLMHARQDIDYDAMPEDAADEEIDAWREDSYVSV